jgi:phytoene dehydrogenase-like protein
MTERAPIIVVGGGHNGLVCAAYLARAGRRVLVLEAAAQAGGCAATHEFHPGFKVSSIAHLLYGFDAQVAGDLNLTQHGLAFAQQNLRSAALHPAAEALVFDGDSVSGAGLDAADRDAFQRFVAARRRFAAVLASWHAAPPPRLALGGWRDALPVAKLGWAVRRLGRRDMRELLRIATMSVDDWLNEYFTGARIKGALALDAVLGTRSGPRHGGTVFTSLHRAAGGGVYSVPQGGMGSLSAALVRAATAAGAQVRCQARVAGFEVVAGRVGGVRLASGETLSCSGVVSALDPRQTLLGLLGARHLEAEFARRVQHVRATGTAAKLHLALSRAPEFHGLKTQDLGERLLIAPDADYVERAFNPAKYSEYSPQPVMEIHLPSIHDAGMAPAGQQVLSAIVQYAPHDLAAGWPAARSRFLETCLETLARHAPGLRASILHAELLTPADIAARVGITGGHWHHGELALDQYLMLRPVPGAAQYQAPVAGLYLCSAGTHPGGGVLGTPGRLAAAQLLAQEAAP